MGVVLDDAVPSAPSSLSLNTSAASCGSITTNIADPAVPSLAMASGPVCGLMSAAATPSCGLPELITEDEAFVLIAEDGTHIYLAHAFQVVP